jgi:hypothetical protein
MLGQWAACRPAPFEGEHRNVIVCRRGCHLRRRLGLRRIRLQVGKLKLKLIEQRTALRGLAEPIVPQLPDRELSFSINSARYCASLSAAAARSSAALSAWRRVFPIGQQNPRPFDPARRLGSRLRYRPQSLHIRIFERQFNRSSPRCHFGPILSLKAPRTAHIGV